MWDFLYIKDIKHSCFLPCGLAAFLPRLGKVCEVHLSNEAPANASIVTVLQQNSLLPAVRLIALCPVSTHSQVKLHKLRPFSVQIPAYELPQPSLLFTHKKGTIKTKLCITSEGMGELLKEQ